MVVALLALVIAASGTAMSATGRVSGDKLIKRGTLSGNRLRDHTLTGRQVNLSKLGKVPRAIVSDRTAQLLVSRPRAAHHGAGDTQGAATSGVTGGLVHMSIGDTVTVLQEDPFTLTATCTGDSNGKATVTENVTSSEDGWTDLFLKQHSAGEAVQYFQLTGSTPQFNLFVPAIAVAPSGATIATGLTELGVHAFGSDCVIYQYAIG